MVETAIVIGIVMVLVTVALFEIQPTLKQARSDAAAAFVSDQIRVARQRAIDERRNYEIIFVAPQTINLFQGTYDAQSGATSYALIGSLDLPNDMQFQLPAKLPTAAPDGFDQSDAIDFSVVNSTTPSDKIVLRPDGSIVDATVQGPTNGVVYMARSGDIFSARAVSIFGATGRVKSWRLSGDSSAPSWVQL
jgi:type II secretory pathway pseudopilin PulG